ncbi:MAG: response regulator [Desulfotomaculaceae bacterium]|nr:response regulator [Desulfotomaculaceae bacterium]
MSQTSVLVVDDIANVREDIKRLLYFEEDIAVVGEAGGGHEAIQLAENLKPDVVLMDVNMPDMDGITASEAIADKIPDTAVVIISIQSEPEYLRKAMAAGARDYLVKPFSSSELADTIRRVGKLYKVRAARAAAVPPVTLTKPEPAAPENKIIVVFSSKGGVGKTVISCNLAVCMAQESRKKVALVDLNLQSGDATLMLNLASTRSIADLVQEEDLMEYSLVNSYMVPHMSGLKVLPAPLRPEQAEVVTTSHVETIFTLLKEHYDYIIVDTSPLFNDLNLGAMEMADDIILTFTRGLPAVKHTRTALDVLDTLNLSKKVKLLLNQSTLDYGVKISDLEKSLSTSLAGILPYDEKIVLSSINKGCPFIMTHLNSKIGQAIRNFAGQWTLAAVDTAPEIKKKKSIISKFFCF